MPYQELTGGLIGKIDRCRPSLPPGNTIIMMIPAQP
jgi:hypothetical protein